MSGLDDKANQSSDNQIIVVGNGREINIVVSREVQNRLQNTHRRGDSQITPEMLANYGASVADLVRQGVDPRKFRNHYYQRLAYEEQRKSIKVGEIIANAKGRYDPNLL